MEILILIVSIFVSLIPSIILYLWIKKKGKDDKFKEICKKAFTSGAIAVFPIILLSMTFDLIGKITGLEKSNPLLYQAYYNFITLAFAEELVKFLAFKYVPKKIFMVLFNNIYVNGRIRLWIRRKYSIFFQFRYIINVH